MIRNHDNGTISKDKIDNKMMDLADDDRIEIFNKYIDLLTHIKNNKSDDSEELAERINNKLNSKYSNSLGINTISKCVVIPNSITSKIDKLAMKEQNKFNTHSADMDKTDDELSNNKKIGSRSELGLTSISQNYNLGLKPTKDHRGEEYVKYDFIDDDGNKYDLKTTDEDSYGANIIYKKDNSFDMRLDKSKHYTYDDHNIDDWANVDKFQSKIKNKTDRCDYIINSIHFELNNCSLIIYTSKTSTSKIANEVTYTTYQDDKNMFLYPQYNRNQGKNRTIYLLRSFIWENNIAEYI